MAYSVTVYKNTGFNAGNIPDSPALLEQCAKLNALPTLEILQDSGLDRIYIKATLSEITGADYVKVGSWYYIVDGMPKMTSADVVCLPLIPDAVTSAGGAGTLSYTDGITERVCVPTSSDTFGAYTEADPLTAPSQALDLRLEQSTYTNLAERVFIEATIDLPSGGAPADSSGQYPATATEAITYTDPASGESCTVPYMPDVSVITTHKYGGQNGTCTFTLQSGAGYPDTREGMKRARGLGMESAIIAQYSVPEVYIDASDSSSDADGRYTRLAGKEDTLSTSTLVWEQGTVKNKRALYGEYTKYGIITMGGNKGEYRAEDIYESGTSSPTVKVKVDARAQGCPYWRYSSFLGDSSDAGFWRNCLAGAPWKNVPLVYSEKSGNILDRQMFEASREYEAKERTREIWNDLWSGTKNLLSTKTQGTTHTFNETTGKYTSSWGNLDPVDIGISAGVSVLDTTYRMMDARDRYHELGELAALRYGQSQVVAPDLQFPFNTDIMRDALKNVCICYRYYYKAADLARIDKLLTMYGYRFTKPLEASDFTNRPKFNYVKTQGGVTVCGNSGGRLPKWWNDLISAQLSAGVRVWHILPTVSAYSDNT